MATDSIDACVAEIAALIAQVGNLGPMLRLGTVSAVATETVTVDGVDMAYIATGIPPLVGRVGVYLRQATSTVWVGMLAE
jgi:hypothetical protein